MNKLTTRTFAIICIVILATGCRKNVILGRDENNRALHATNSAAESASDNVTSEDNNSGKNADMHQEADEGQESAEVENKNIKDGTENLIDEIKQEEDISDDNDNTIYIQIITTNVSINDHLIIYDPDNQDQFKDSIIDTFDEEYSAEKTIVYDIDYADVNVRDLVRDCIDKYMQDVGDN